MAMCWLHVLSEELRHMFVLCQDTPVRERIQREDVRLLVASHRS